MRGKLGRAIPAGQPQDDVRQALAHISCGH
jgi:hypothetical protein